MLTSHLFFFCHCKDKAGAASVSHSFLQGVKMKTFLKLLPLYGSNLDDLKCIPKKPAASILCMATKKDSNACSFRTKRAVNTALKQTDPFPQTPVLHCGSGSHCYSAYRTIQYVETCTILYYSDNLDSCLSMHCGIYSRVGLIDCSNR